jgi:hypothetical protein
MSNFIRNDQGQWRSYSERVKLQTDHAPKQLVAKNTTAGVMYLLNLSNVVNQAVTTYNESKGKNKMALLPMTHFVDNYRNTSQQFNLLNNVDRVQHGECVEMMHGRLWKSTTHIGQDHNIHQAFKSMSALVQIFQESAKILIPQWLIFYNPSTALLG